MILLFSRVWGSRRLKGGPGVHRRSFPLLLLAAWWLASAPAAAETWSTFTSENGVRFRVRLQSPRLIRKVPLVDGVRWDIQVANRVRNTVVKPLARGPIKTVTIQQDGAYVRVVARWRFPYAITGSFHADHFDFFMPDVITRHRTVPIADGVTFQRVMRWTQAGPFSIGVIRANLRTVGIRPQIARSNRGFGLTTVSSLARQAGAIAAVNGTFFTPGRGDPVGLIVQDGQVVHSSFLNRSVFGVRYDGSCFVDNARLKAAIRLSNGHLFAVTAVNRPPVRDQTVLYTSHWASRTGSIPDPSRREVVVAADGTIEAVNTGNSFIPVDGYVISAQGKALQEMLRQVRIGQRATVFAQLSDVWLGVQCAVGGGPTLVQRGKVLVTAREERFQADIARGRAPRTAIGYVGDTGIVLVTVDGRQATSVGMTLYELARFMRELGAVEAINLDGGGSTAMVVRGKLVNRPSDGFERPVSNALVLVPS